ncbi:hypothetical protein D3C87_1573130 [compost metagenome]
MPDMASLQILSVATSVTVSSPARPKKTSTSSARTGSGTGSMVKLSPSSVEKLMAVSLISTCQLGSLPRAVQLAAWVGPTSSAAARMPAEIRPPVNKCNGLVMARTPAVLVIMVLAKPGSGFWERIARRLFRKKGPAVKRWDATHIKSALRIR